jgi:hypothetical protein
MRASIPALLLVLLPGLVEAQRPAGWRVIPDIASTDSVAFALMPPGWHVTTPATGGAILFNPENTATGRFALSLEVFLFPGTSEEGYGLFLGGSALDGERASYVAVTVRRDGRLSVWRTQGTGRAVLLDWAPNDAVIPHPGGDEAQRNALRVSVEPDSLRFEANGKRITALARGDLVVDGVFGLRAGRDVNLHVSNLDHTVRLAPAPRARRP